jgi:hypothetical protein
MIAFAIGYYALKGYRLVRERTLFFLHFSFILLGAGLLTDGVVSMPVLAFRGLSPMMAIGYMIRITAEIIAYTLLLLAHLRHTRSVMAETTMPVVASGAVPLIEILPYHPLLEIVVFFLVMFTAAQTAMNYGVRRDRNSLLVFIGFVLLAASHVLFIFPPIIRFFFALAHVTQLLGFLALLTMLLRVTRTK